MQVDFTAFPEGLADLMTISDAAAGLLLTVVLIGIFTVPILWYSQSILLSFFVGILVVLVTVMIGWVDVYFFVFSAIVFAVYAALEGRDQFGG